MTRQTDDGSSLSATGSSPHAIDASLIDTETTKTVLQRKIDAIMSPNMEDHVADYADDAIIATPETIVQGVAAIRVYFAGLLNWTRTPDAEFDLRSEFVQGEFAYITWSLRTLKLWVPLGTDTFVIRGGKILFHAMASDYQARDE